MLVWIPPVQQTSIEYNAGFLFSDLAFEHKHVRSILQAKISAQNFDLKMYLTIF